MELRNNNQLEASPELLQARIDELESEVTALQNELEHARREAHIDHLTGALNRRGFELLIEQEWERLQRARYSGEPHDFTLLVIDIDRFKEINDTFGHGAGDAVLANLGARVQERIRESDIFARLGGDEFVIGLLDTNSESAELLKKDLQTLFALPVAYLDQQIETGFIASIGLASYSDEESWSELLARADARLYEDKHDSDLTTSS